MPQAIGAAGQMGIAAEVLGSVQNFAGSPAAGGSLTAGTYKYYITAINANGETAINVGVTTEVTVTTAAGNLTAALTWAALTGATGYKIYRTAAGGATGTELLITTLGVVTSFNDTTVGSPLGAFLVLNKASVSGTFVVATRFFTLKSASEKLVMER